MKAQYALLSCLTATLAQASTPPLSRRPANATGVEPSAIPGAYIVELEDNENADSFYGELRGKNVRATPRMDLSFSMFKGVSFQIEEVSGEDPDASAMRIASMPKVRKLWPVHVHERPDDEILWVADPGNVDHTPPIIGSGNSRRASDNDTFSPHVMTQVDKLRAEGVTGKGIRIGVVDTGVDYLHPALGGCFGEGCLVAYGTDLVGDDYDGNNAPKPDNDPYDNCAGHGTHVSGIIAAQKNELGFTGAAPGVTLGAYRVFGCNGPAGDDVLIAAFAQAYEDGSDIITASIGGPRGWSEYPWSVVASRIVAAGVPVTISAGNSGDAGVFFASSAADGKGVTAVASIDNTEEPYVITGGVFSADGKEEEKFGYTVGTPAFANVTLPLWAASNSSDAGPDACNALPEDTPDLADYLVLIRDAGCSWVAQAENVAAKGGKYIMLHLTSSGVPSAVYVANVKEIEGVGMTTYEQGTEWIELLNKGENVTVDITEAATAPVFLGSFPNNQTGGLLSEFTSWGPTWEVDVKPQIASPGGMILSTMPLDLGAYAAMSGTSMACPLLAATYALIAEVRGTTDPATLEALVVATANKRPWAENTSDLLAPVPQQGGGLVQAHDAAHATTLLSITGISFNDTDHFVESADFEIRNLGDKEVVYELGHVPAASVYLFNADPADLYPAYYPPPIAEGEATLAFSESKVTVPEGGSAKITVKATPPSGVDERRIPVYSGYVTLSGSNGEELSLPYLGVAGSLHDSPSVLDPEWVYLSNWTDYNLDKSPAGTAFKIPYPEDPSGQPIAGVSYPATIIQLNVGTALLQVDVVPVNGGGNGTAGSLGDPIGSATAFPIEYSPRRYYITAFTGMLADGKVAPEGRYLLRVSALKLFGDRENKDDYESYDTVEFELAYESTP